MPYLINVITSVECFLIFLSVNTIGVIYSSMSFKFAFASFRRDKNPIEGLSRSSTFICRYNSKLGLLFGPLCNCAVNVH